MATNNNTPAAKAAASRYRKSEKGKVARERFHSKYRQTDKHKAYISMYNKNRKSKNEQKEVKVSN